jgi:hypothetical protein
LVQESEQDSLFLMFNAGTSVAEFNLPQLPHGFCWRLAVDTSHETSQGLFAPGEESLSEDPFTYRMASRSSAILLARRAEIK